MIQRFSALFCTVILLLGSAPTWAQRQLNISELPPQIQDELSQRFPQIRTEKLRAEQLDEVVRFLQIRPQLAHVRILDEGEGKPYKLEAEFTRIIGDLKFQGTQSLTNFELNSTFTTRSGDVFDQQELIEQGERLRQLYREKGFLNAVIDIEMPPGTENKTEVNIKVTENQRTRIREIVIQSPNESLNKKLRSEVKSYIDNPYTDKELGEIHQEIREYLTEERYVRADITGPTLQFNKDESFVDLLYRVDKVDHYNFKFIGIRFLNRGDVEDAMDLDNYTSGSPAVGTDLAQKIKAMYLSKGYARAEVAVEEALDDKPFERRVIFRINEGPRVKIDDIEISGRFSQKPSYYTKFLQDHSSRLIKKGFYVRDDIETGLKNLTLELQNNGFLFAKVLSTRTQYNKSKDRVTLHINLDEGPLTKVQSISFDGNNSFPEAELLKVTGLKIGPLKLEEIETAVGNLKNFYQEKGYIEMMILNEKEDLVSYDDSNTEAQLHFKIYEGPQVRVASIILEGNSFTKDYVLLKELEFKPGELVTPKKIQESTARLQRTGFFSSVEVRTLEEKSNVANRTVLVKVSERDPGVFLIGAGATNERTLTLRGYMGVSYRNLLGTGRGLSLRLEGNYNVADIRYLESRVVLGYLEPYLLGSRFRGRINITRSQTITDYDLKQVTELNSTTYSIEKDFTSHILGVWDVWSLATYRDFGVDDDYPDEYKTETNIATTGPTIDLDFRDNPFVPTSGNFTRLNAEYSAPFMGSSDTINYIRATASFTHYAKVDEWQLQPVVWANQLSTGYIKNLSDDSNGGVPWDKKGFTLGGRSTVRGYEAGSNEAFPNKEEIGDKYFLTTEANMYLFKSEIRFPVFGNLGGAFFYDGGAVLIQGLEFEDSYRDSAGFGIRYNTPVGPLSLEFAWKLDRKPNEDPWKFHLAIGTF